MKKTYDLLHEPIPRLIRLLAIPASIGYFFNTMFNVVDTWYGGLISTDALASLSISFPVFFIIIAITAGIGIGATVLIAHALGAGEREKAKLYSAQALTFGFLVSLVTTFIGWLSAPYIFRLLGAADEYLEGALSYVNIIFGGTFFFVYVGVLNASLTAWGDTKTFRNTLIVGCLLNLLLNPWFIFGGFGMPAFGFKGIALSSVIIEALSCFYLGYKTCKTGLLCRQSFALLWPRAKCLAELARNVLPAGINMLALGIGIFVILYFTSRFDKSAVAAYGVATRIEQIILLPSIGLSMATLTIVGQNYGARQYDRMREAVFTSIRYGFYIMLAGGIVIFVFATPLMTAFTKETNVIVVGAQYLRIASLVLWAYVIQFVTISALQGMQRPMYAVWIGLYRQIVAPIVIFPFLAHILGWGLYGIWWGIFFVTWSAALFSLYCVQHKMQRIATLPQS